MENLYVSKFWIMICKIFIILFIVMNIIMKILWSIGIYKELFYIKCKCTYNVLGVWDINWIIYIWYILIVVFGDIRVGKIFLKLVR